MKQGMTIDQVRAAKRKAQAEIQDILVDLCNDTGLGVDAVEVRSIRYEMCGGGESPSLIEVRIRMEVI